VRLAYAILTWFLTPLLVAHLYWRSLGNAGYRRRIGERFGRVPWRQSGPVIWVHAVSVGEVQAAAALIRRLKDRYAERAIVVTTTTPTGSARVTELFGGSVAHAYLPFDLAPAVRRFFDAARPGLAIIMETELWPNLYLECRRRGVPLVLANARMSEKSLRRYRLLAGLIGDTIGAATVAAQSATDAGRFRELGASREHTHIVGNIKFDFEIPPEAPAAGQELRALHAPDRPVWIAASTHADEDGLLLSVHRRVLAARPDVLLIIVPRHPERFSALAGQLGREGFSFVTRSSGAVCGPDTQVFLGDTMGELNSFYAAADVAFVGGSLVPVGGHNLLEPAGLGVPVLTGPHNFNAADVATLLTDSGAARVAGDSGELGDWVLRLLGDERLRREAGKAGREAIARNRGALDRLFELIGPVAG